MLIKIVAQDGSYLEEAQHLEQHQLTIITMCMEVQQTVNLEEQKVFFLR